MVPRFADPAHEAAFKQRYAEQRRSQDYFLLTVRCKWRMIAHPPRARHNSVPARLGGPCAQCCSCMPTQCGHCCCLATPHHCCPALVSSPTASHIACLRAQQPTALHTPAVQPAAPLVLFAAMRSLRDGEWKAVALSCFEAALFVALQLAMRHAPAAYLRWRSMLLTAVYLGHFSVRVGS